MPKIRRYFLSLWKLWDPLYYTFSHLKYIDDQDRKNRVFRVKLVRYKGRNVILSDGTQINKNDLLLKIHLHNVRLLIDMAKLDGEFRKGLYIYKRIKSALPKVAKFIQDHEKTKEIKAIIGITSLHQGSERLGFETHRIMNRYYFWFKYIAQYPIHLLSTSEPFKRNGKKQIPMYLFMSKINLIDRYGKVSSMDIPIKQSAR